MQLKVLPPTKIVIRFRIFYDGLTYAEITAAINYTRSTMILLYSEGMPRSAPI